MFSNGANFYWTDFQIIGSSRNRTGQKYWCCQIMIPFQNGSDRFSTFDGQYRTCNKMTKVESIEELMTIPSIGRSIANDFWNIGIASIADLKGKDPEMLFDLSNRFAGVVQDRCLLYSFRCAVYYTSTKPELHDPELLKWWNWKDSKK